jgi:DNA-binding Lrp family transcriptional regulator
VALFFKNYFHKIHKSGYVKYMETLSLDSIDLELLAALQQDATPTNQQLAALLGISPPTCLRRVRRLREAGLIARQVAILDPEVLAAALGHGLHAVGEVLLDRQTAEAQDAFEARAVAEPCVAQCWRMASGADFVLVLQVRDMPHYLQLAARLFTQDANVRNVKLHFATRRAKIETKLPLAQAQ